MLRLLLGMLRLGLLMILVQMVILHQILGMLRLVLARLIRRQILARLVQVLCLQDKLRHPQTHSRTVQLGPYRYLSVEAQELLVPLGMLRLRLGQDHLAPLRMIRH